MKKADLHGQLVTAEIKKADWKPVGLTKSQSESRMHKKNP
jgi:hypothetical protein